MAVTVARYYRWVNAAGKPPTIPTLSVTDNGDGSGGVVTVSGSTSTAVNVLYEVPWTGLSGPLAWQSIGSRTGDGSISVSSNFQGQFLWQVVSFLNGQQTQSSPVFQALTGASTSSVLNTVLDQTAAAVTALGLTLNGSVFVAKKKVAREIDEVDPVTAIMISGEQVVDSWKPYTFKNVRMTYHVRIDVRTLGYADFVANLPTYCSWRQQIRTRFSQPGNGVYTNPPVFDQNVDPGDFIDRSAFNENNRDAQILTVDVLTAESWK
jgi:hypothetical protein